MVLDLALPARDGFSVLEELRRTSDLPVIVLTARGLEPDKIRGLELGAEDYMTKPFSPRELLARIETVLRRFEDTAVSRIPAEPLEQARLGKRCGFDSLVAFRDAAQRARATIARLARL